VGAPGSDEEPTQAYIIKVRRGARGGDNEDVRIKATWYKTILSCPIKAKENGSPMKPKIIIAIILIALGIAAFAYQGITYTTREKVVDLGPIQVTTEKTKTLPLPPIVGAIALVGGIVLLVPGSRKDLMEAEQ